MAAFTQTKLYPAFKRSSSSDFSKKTGILQKAGKRVKSKSTLPLLPLTSQSSSTYIHIPEMHLGMRNKPLVPYKPNAPRSLLSKSFPCKSFHTSGSSSLQIGNNCHYSPVKVFKTIYQCYMIFPQQNSKTISPGIAADQTKWIKSKIFN